MAKQGKKKAAVKAVRSKFDVRWFEKRMIELDIVTNTRAANQRELARLLGWNPSDVNRLFKGHRVLQTREAPELASVLKVSPVEVFARAGIQIDDDRRAIPIIGHVDGTGQAYLNLLARGGPAPALSNLPADAVAARMQTAASSLDVFDGFTLYFSPWRENLAPGAEHIGRLCIVKVRGDGPPVLRSLRRGYKAGTWNLSSICSPDVTDVTLEWATPVLMMRPPVE